jgi:tRNA isopentenyl-2-thiomethyl-A-37 hydroxylase MiaE
VWIDVFHNDRDIEFIQVKRWLENLYSQAVLKLDFKSCEMMADDLYIQIADRYPDRAVWIEVAEDGENGCLIKYELSRPNLSIKI